MHVSALKSRVNSQFLIVTLTFCFSVHPFCTQVCRTNQQDGLAGKSLTETSGSLQILQERWTWSQREMKTEGHTIDSPPLVWLQPVSSAFFFDCSNADVKFPDISISKKGPFTWMTTLKPHTCHCCKNHTLLYRIQRKCKKKNIYKNIYIFCGISTPLSLPFCSQSSPPSLLYVKPSLLASFCLSSEPCGINLPGNLQMFWVKYKDDKGRKFLLYFIIHHAAIASK